MRRILVSGFAAIASFSVLANNFVPVTAPAAEGYAGPAGFSPQGMARLSDQPAYTPVTQIPVQPAETTAAPQPPDVTAFAPHTLANEFETADRPAPATITEAEKQLVATRTDGPSTNIRTAKLEALPAIAGTEILSGTSEHATASVNVDVITERSIAVPESTNYKSSPQPALLATASEGPIDFFTPRSLNKMPASIADSRILADESEHRFADAGVAAVSERTAFEPEATAFMPKVPAFVTASYQAPETIFQRARFVAEPDAPASIEVLTAGRNVHRVPNESDRATFERTQATAEKAWLPALVSTITEVASSIFERPRIVEENDAPVSTDVLASSGTHALSGDTAAIAERHSETVKPEAAPYLPAFISTLAVAPSAAFHKMGLLPMPEAPVSNAVLAANNAHTSANAPTAASIIERGNATPDRASAPVKNSPVLISNQTAINANLLKPMSAGPLVNAPLPNENAVASNGYNPTPFDRMLVTPDVPEAVLKAQPTLISSKTEFSNALLKPMNAPINPFAKLEKEEIIAAVQQRDNYCDPNFVGQPIRFSQTVELKLDDLLRQLHQRFGVNFIVGKGVADLPMNIKAGSIPWNVLLRSQLFISGVRARCIDENTIELVENQQLPRLQDGADVETRFIKLKFLQRTSSGSVDLAGRGQGGGGGQNGQGGGCSAGGGQGGGLSGGGGGGQGGGQQSETAATQSSSKFDKLVIEIEKILGLRSMTESSAGGQGGQGGSQTQTTEAIRTNRFVTQIPGRNILTIRATKEEHELIDQIIARADRPPFQVVVKGLVYTANQDKLRDIGVSTNIFGGTADGRHTGSVIGNTLGAAGTIFDFSTIIGTFDFNVQATALEQNGVLSVKSRPFSTVIDGLCARLNVGRSIPIIIDSSLGGQGALEFIDALNKLDVTPHVIDDENGDPVAVTLELTMFANDVDNSVIARGVPAISERSIQTQLLLAEDKTAILGGFTVDQASRTVEKTPGLGDIPIIGQLFKRRVNDKRVNRLYFAISVDVIPYPEAIRPVDVPGATTDIPSITPEQKKRADAAEPKQVKGP